MENFGEKENEMELNPLEICENIRAISNALFENSHELTEELKELNTRLNGSRMIAEHFFEKKDEYPNLIIKHETILGFFQLISDLVQSQEFWLKINIGALKRHEEAPGGKFQSLQIANSKRSSSEF